MAKCSNCDQKSYGDFCQWCNYPLLRRIFVWQASRKRYPRKLAEPPELKVKQIIRDVREEARKGKGKETEIESARVIAESKRKAAELAEEMKREAEIEAERIIEETTAQIVEEKPPSPVYPIGPQFRRPVVQGKVPVNNKIKVFVIDDQELFRQGLRLLLSQTDDIELIGESGFLEYTVDIIGQLGPNLVLIDINLPWLSGLGLAQRVSQRSPDISVIILTSYEDDNHIFEAIKAGVAGYLSKCIAPQGVASAVRKVFRGEHIIDELMVRPGVAQRVLKQFQGMEKEGLTKPLNPKEMEILGYFANGYLCQQVAQAMGVNEQQITNQMASIVSKNLPPTGASNTTTA